jgi:hypothetical protein
MNWLQFIASLVGSLAWPATLVIAIFVLRDPITRALLTLTRLRYKDLELDFGHELKQLEKKARALDIPPQPARTLIPVEKHASQLLEEATPLAHDFPEPAVALGWQAVEDELMSAVKRLAISADYPPYNSALKNARLLREQNAIDENTFDLLNRMRNLRNMAVHRGQGPTRITVDEALEFLALARGVVQKLQSAKRA